MNCRIALIGHSGAGKTACIKLLGLHPTQSDMDKVFDLAQPSVADALEWIALSQVAEAAVTVSNHEAMLLQLAEAKLTGQHSPLFGGIQFVYLHKPIERLRRHLYRKDTDGKKRSADCIQRTLATYQLFHSFFATLADQVIHCVDERSLEQVAESVRAIVEREVHE